MSILRVLNRLREWREAQICAPYFDRVYYLQQNADVARSGADPLHHFLRWGWMEGRDPSPNFSLEDYRRQTPHYDPLRGNPLTHAITSGVLHRTELQPLPVPAIREEGSANRGKDASTNKMPSDADVELVRQAMDESWYLERYPAVATSGLSPTTHYLTVGWKLGFDPSPRFSTSYYLQGNADLRKYPDLNPFVHYLRHGKNEPSRVWADVVSAEAVERFRDGALTGDLRRAIALDPLVALPEGRRVANSPLIHSADARAAVRTLRQRFAGQRFDYVVVIPHVRMSGAARVAGEFVSALSRTRTGKRVLVVLTDLNDLEHPEWFPEECEFVRLAEFWTGPVAEPARIAVLLDLIYEVEAKAVVNVNSRLFWNALTTYGRQLRQELAIGTYLFTWEETLAGNRVGYPIQWLRDCVGWMDAIACDAGHLAKDVSTRFGLTGGDLGSVHTLRTPMDGAGGAFRPRAECGRRRVLWAGRFDRQKRPDVLRAVALACPDVEFDVYGRAVLDAGLEKQLRGIPNLTLQGEFDRFDDVAGKGYGLFLYTAQWDGMPTIVLDAIRSGLPVIAPDVGGLSEVIASDTGWLIESPDDVEGYVAAVAEALSNPDAARLRASAAFDKAQEMFARDAYDAAVAQFMDEIDEAADGRT
ncbi:glycosyltransferase family 4 protein [Paracoccus sp. TK19116]|uniref:Glycosyltransferase family 4 protein n=1 Tax=Paracoccus albicereus TaxID=2922394 RepID=A0ABT1MSF5_9RHOB|nr:glycosyltransferase family 4 protein [Paracoccus albicereus]MCQ0971233.1 glycosyltransferase family 4 protein [Paracoccus albicereus]